MSKFKVGDRVMVIGTISGTIIDINSAGIVIECDDPQKGVSIHQYPNKMVLWPNENQVKLIAPDRHELHITSDGVTTNAVYKLNGKVTKTAKAVCCPSDTFNFNTGAELAINRVLYGTDYNPHGISAKEPINIISDTHPCAPKQEDKPNCRIKDTIRFVGNANDCAVDNLIYGRQAAKFFKAELQNRIKFPKPTLTVTHDMLVKLGACSGGMTLFDKLFPSGKGEFEDVCAQASKNGNENYSEWLDYRKSNIEAMQNQPKEEAVTLYCVKDYVNYCGIQWLTKGKTYEFNGFGVTYDSNFCESGRTNFSEWKSENPNVSACLIRAEKRPAKVGEWIVLTKNPICNAAGGKYCEGNLVKITNFGIFPSVKMSEPTATLSYVGFRDDEYLVLPDYKPEKVEPTYWSGKVVCVDVGETSKWWTKGKVYTYKDGYTTADNGEISPCGTPAITNIEELENYGSVKFIEYRGEQSC